MRLSSAELEKRVARFLRVCRDSSLRVTPQRMAIYREVARTEQHPNAETVLAGVRKQMPTVSLDTVYRTLATLGENGLIARVEMPSGPARFDANTERHHHFVCTECGSIHDFYSSELDGFDRPQEVVDLGTVASVHVQLRGICARCAVRRRERPTSGGTAVE